MTDTPPSLPSAPDFPGAGDALEQARWHEERARATLASDPASAVAHARAALADAASFPSPIRASLHYTAGLCLVASHATHEAREHYVLSARLARESGDVQLALRADLGRAQAFLIDGALDEAATLMLGLEPEARRAGLPRFVCAILNNLGNVFDSLHQPQRAAECFTRALEHARSHCLDYSTALSLCNLGALMALVGELDRGRQLLTESIEIYRRIDDRDGRAQAEGNLALLLEREGRLDDAIDHHRMALEHFESVGDVDNILTSLTQIASLEQRRGDPATAVALLNRALAHVEEHRLVEGIWSIHAQLSSVFEELGDAPRALLHYRQAAEMRQQIDASVNRLALHELQGTDAPGRRMLELQHQVDAHDREFLRLLSSRYPTLTPAELRVCSLLRDNLSTKEMAQILKVSERNIESHRYAVRRKLDLPRGIQLPTFLAAL